MTETTAPRYFIAGSARMIPGTGLPANVTGDCPHRHRTPEAAQRCIDALDRSIKRGHGRNAYADRVVVAVGETAADRTVVSGDEW